MNTWRRGTDTVLERPVAIKFLTRHSTGQTVPEQLLSEARSASALSHPNVCTILGLRQTIDGRHYIAMEYVGGATLRTRLSGAPLSLGDALDIAIQVAAALSAAHAAGIVHRDIKPENVMIRPDGLVKVLDFGLAKLVTPDDASDGRSTDTFLATRVGTVVGTVGYMSPEQAEGKLVDLRSDVFAFGALLYELTCGRPAFRADSIAGTWTWALADTDGGNPSLMLDPLTAEDAVVYLLGPVLGFIMRLRGIVPLHASAVMIGSGAVVDRPDGGV